MPATTRDLLGIACALGALAGCGVRVPPIQEAWDRDLPGDPATRTPPLTGTAQIEFEIRKRIYCELREAVQAANEYATVTTIGGRAVDARQYLPPDWGAQVSISLEVDESASLNPGLALNTPMPTAMSFFGALAPVATPQSFVQNLGGSLSSTATRIDKFNPYYTIEYLGLAGSDENVCMPGKDPFARKGSEPAASSPIIESRLGLREWLVGALFGNNQIPSVSEPIVYPSASRKRAGRNAKSPKGPTITPTPDTLSIEVRFVIVSSGNATPTWKLVRVSANTGSTPFFAIGRTRTHDVIITIGPRDAKTEQANLALQIGQAVNASRGASQNALGP